MKNNIIKFKWNNAKNEDYAGNHLIIGQHLPKAQNEEVSHAEIYGISLNILDTKKDFQLPRQSCYTGNIVDAPIKITKKEARACLIEEIDKALDLLYAEEEQKLVDQEFNVEPEIYEEEDE